MNDLMGPGNELCTSEIIIESRLPLLYHVSVITIILIFPAKRIVPAQFSLTKIERSIYKTECRICPRSPLRLFKFNQLLQYMYIVSAHG